jgi:hypothetical protein
MRNKRSRYTGELASRIILPSAPTFELRITDESVDAFWHDQERHQREAEESLNRTLQRKMSLLFKHYRIREGDIAALTWALAFAHVPGFEMYRRSNPIEAAKRSGTVTNWTRSMRPSNQ